MGRSLSRNQISTKLSKTLELLQWFKIRNKNPISIFYQYTAVYETNFSIGKIVKDVLAKIGTSGYIDASISCVRQSVMVFSTLLVIPDSDVKGSFLLKVLRIYLS